MAVPGFQDFMLPMLRIASDGREHSIADVRRTLADALGLSEQDRAQMLPSGQQTQLANRVSWAASHLAMGGLVERTARGRYRITPRGSDVLSAAPARVDLNFLGRFPEAVEFRNRRGDRRPRAEMADSPSADSEATPAERLDAAYRELRSSLAEELIQRVRATTPAGFETLVVRLLVAMGYGGGRVDRAEVTGRSGDDGIDGVIREDKLGLDSVYVQAKKWDGSVGPGEIDKFVGALMRKKARKGVFITSGEFTDGARRAAVEATVTVRLIDGDDLADLMIDHDVGVSKQQVLVTRRIDSDFFDELDI